MGRVPKSLRQRQTVLIILRAAERAVPVGGAGRGCRRDHPRARTGRAAPSRTALRSVGTGRHLLVSVRVPRADDPGGRTPRRALRSTAMSALAPGLQAFFTDRLIGQRAASPNTIGAYKTSLRLLLGFAAQRTAKAPAALDIAELDAPLIAAFLGHLEADRHNSVATRNNRLAAVHSLFAYLALHHPEHAASIQRVLAIPPKRTERNLLTYLTDPEAHA